MSSLNSRILTSTSAVVIAIAGISGLATPAFAQAADEPDPTCASVPEGPERDKCLAGEVELESGQDATGPAESPSGDIVVTGTRINRPTLTSTVPVTSVGVVDLANQGNVSLGDKIAELPQMRATFTQANSTRFIGTSGINALDLRGLGTARTLVLVNGRRVITATPGINRPDVNSIPIDLVERIDIVTGGNSAIYGSDAVAGVVNFVTRRNFEGIRLSGQAGASSRGDRGSYFISGVAGMNFADDRGNIAVAAEYAKQNTLWFTDRDNQTGAYSGRNQFNAFDDFTGIVCHPTVIAQLGVAPTPGVCGTAPNLLPGIPAEPAAGDDLPDQIFLEGVRNNNISEGGLFSSSCPTAPAGGETQAQFLARRSLLCTGIPTFGSTNVLAQIGRTFVFMPDGSLVANPCVTNLGNVGSPNCIGGLGSTLRLTGQLAPGLERKAVNLLAHFEVSPAFEPFVEGKYVWVEANQEGQPTFANNVFSVNNPFLSTQARNLLLAAVAPGGTLVSCTTAGLNALPPSPALTGPCFAAQRFNIDFGGRGELHERENYQAVAGVRGQFNGDWRYEVSFNYGGLYTYYETKGNVLRANYVKAINAVVHPTSGQIVCAVNADASTVNDDPACVPLNLFGHGAPSPEALNYVLHTSSRKQKARLYDLMGYVSGDSSQLFELPGGPVGFVLGAEWRKETAFAAYDDVTASTACGTSGCTFLNVIPDFDPPDLKTKEVFGEINIPLLRDFIVAEELTLSAAGRYSDYNIGNTGGVFAWNVNGIWAPFRDLRFRAGLARSIRAPTQSDLFSPATQTFINNFVDPCSQNQINNGPQVGGVSVRIANCAAHGVPTTQTFGGTTLAFTNVPASGLLANNQGNEDLAEERGTSLTIGAVLQPRFIPGLSLTVDYYRIKVDDVILALLGQNIINLCYDNLTGVDNPFCAVVFRRPDGTFAGQQNVVHGGTTFTFAPTGPSALITSFNFAKLETSGIDFDMAYRRSLGNDVTLHLRGILSRTFKKNLFSDPTDLTFKDRILSELGDPEWQGQLSTNLEIGRFNLGHRVRYVHRQIKFVAGTGQYETFFEWQGRDPTNPDVQANAWYPAFWSHDFRVEINPTDRFKFYVGVDNAFDKLPPLDLLGTESGSPSPVGRAFYAGAVARF